MTNFELWRCEKLFNDLQRFRILDNLLDNYDRLLEEKLLTNYFTYKDEKFNKVVNITDDDIYIIFISINVNSKCKLGLYINNILIDDDNLHNLYCNSNNITETIILKLNKEDKIVIKNITNQDTMNINTLKIDKFNLSKYEFDQINELNKYEKILNKINNHEVITNEQRYCEFEINHDSNLESVKDFELETISKYNYINLNSIYLINFINNFLKKIK